MQLKRIFFYLGFEKDKTVIYVIELSQFISAFLHGGRVLELLIVRRERLQKIKACSVTQRKMRNYMLKNKVDLTVNAVKRYMLSILVACLSLLSFAADPASVTISVDSPGFVFSPANWVGDQGRSGGEKFRQSWNPGAYFRFTWESKVKDEVPVLLFDDSTYDGSFPPPVLAACLDGVWSPGLGSAKEVSIQGVNRIGKHILTVYVKKARQVKRWGTPGVSGSNIVRVTGIRLDKGSAPVKGVQHRKWALIIGDSITEGCGAYELEAYSHLVGQTLRSQDYEYAISACGWSGWINRGDHPPGDVPGWYVVRNSVKGVGGDYDEQQSRWNKIDSCHSILDSKGRYSAYGATGQEPSLILINYGTNDSLHRSNPDDVRASIFQSLGAMRKAAPEAQIVFIIPFGQYKARDIYEMVELYQKANPQDKKVSIIDLGPDTARALTVKKGYWGGLHPNPRGHADFAARITAPLMRVLSAAK